MGPEARWEAVGPGGRQQGPRLGRGQEELSLRKLLRQPWAGLRGRLDG